MNNSKIFSSLSYFLIYKFLKTINQRHYIYILYINYSLNINNTHKNFINLSNSTLKINFHLNSKIFTSLINYLIDKFPETINQRHYIYILCIYYILNTNKIIFKNHFKTKFHLNNHSKTKKHPSPLQLYNTRLLTYLHHFLLTSDGECRPLFLPYSWWYAFFLFRR